MNSFIPILILLAGAALGALITWLIVSARAKRAFTDGKAESATQIATLNERFAAKDHELSKLQQALDKEVVTGEALRTENARLSAGLEGERRAAQERSESFKQAAEELSEKFKALSRDALKDNNQSFLELARATLAQFQTSAKGDLELRQLAIDELVKPLQESLLRVDGKIGELEKTRA